MADEPSGLERRLREAADEAITLGLLSIPMVMQEAADTIGEMRRVLVDFTEDTVPTYERYIHGAGHRHCCVYCGQTLCPENCPYEVALRLLARLEGEAHATPSSLQTPGPSLAPSAPEQPGVS